MRKFKGVNTFWRHCSHTLCLKPNISTSITTSIKLSERPWQQQRAPQTEAFIMLDLFLPKFHNRLRANSNWFSAFELKQSINMLMWKFSYPNDGNERAIHRWFHKSKPTDRRLKPKKHLERGMSVCISSQFKDTPKRGLTWLPSAPAPITEVWRGCGYEAYLYLKRAG